MCILRVELKVAASRLRKRKDLNTFIYFSWARTSGNSGWRWAGDEAEPSSEWVLLAQLPLQQGLFGLVVLELSESWWVESCLAHSGICASSFCLRYKLLPKGCGGGTYVGRSGVLETWPDILLADFPPIFGSNIQWFPEQVLLICGSTHLTNGVAINYHLPRITFCVGKRNWADSTKSLADSMGELVLASDCLWPSRFVFVWNTGSVCSSNVCQFANHRRGGEYQVCGVVAVLHKLIISGFSDGTHRTAVNRKIALWYLRFEQWDVEHVQLSPRISSAGIYCALTVVCIS